jgi:DNA-binding NarL/FixJ family response regulator
MTQAIKVLVVDDHPVVREGLSAMLSRLSSLAVLGEAADGQQALDLVRQLKPDVVLMDLRLPVLDGVAATERIVRDFPATRVLILTTFDQDELILAGLRAGARGYLLKDAPREEIAAGIKAVLNFSPGALQVPDDVKLKSVDLTVSLESLSFYLAQGDVEGEPTS